MRGEPSSGDDQGPDHALEGDSRRRRRPGDGRPSVRACSRISSTASSHLVRNGSVRPEVGDSRGNWLLRK